MGSLCRALRKLESRLVLWVSGSSILLAPGHFCSSSLMILLEYHLPGLLPTGQVSFKRYLPSKKIYLSWYRKGIFRALLSNHMRG